MAQLQSQPSLEGMDVMISYSHADKEAMQKLKCNFQLLLFTMDNILFHNAANIIYFIS